MTKLTEISDTSQRKNEFVVDLAACFVRTNIPLHKIRHPKMIEFLEKHTQYGVPSEFTLRNTCLPKLYSDCLNTMRRIAKDNYLWVSLDETTDGEQRYIANFVFGILGADSEKGKSYLFAMKVLDRVDNTTVATFFDESINNLGVCRFVFFQIQVICF